MRSCTNKDKYKNKNRLNTKICLNGFIIKRCPNFQENLMAIK